VLSTATISLRGRRSLTTLVEEFRNDDSGATAIEYGLIVALIFLSIVAAVKEFSSSTSEMYDTIDDTLQSAIN
jgi:pilus assembly protein Flp/PilA